MSVLKNMEESESDSIILNEIKKCNSKSSSSSKKQKLNLSILKKINEDGNQKRPKRKDVTCIRNRKIGLKAKSFLKKQKKAPVENVSYEEFLKTVEFLKNNKSSRDIFKEKCVAPIHLERRSEQKNIGYFSNLLEEARKRLLQKDWYGLAKVLVVCKTIKQSDYTMYLAVILKYAFICLCHNPDKKLLDLFYQSVLLCSNDEEKDEMFKRLTCIKNE